MTGNLNGLLDILDKHDCHLIRQHRSLVTMLRTLWNEKAISRITDSLAFIELELESTLFSAASQLGAALFPGFLHCNLKPIRPARPLGFNRLLSVDSVGGQSQSSDARNQYQPLPNRNVRYCAAPNGEPSRLGL